MNFHFDVRAFIVLTFSFILFTALGTLSHEIGHIAVAKYFGYQTKLHYGSMSSYPKGYLEDEDLRSLNNIKKRYKHLKYKDWPDGVKHRFNKLRDALKERYWSKISQRRLYITMGGPLQTMLTGLVGMFILLYRKRKYQTSELQFLDWVGVFLTLFWLRQIFNVVTSVIGEILNPNGTWFGGDEMKISQAFNIWDGTISLVLGIIGVWIVIYVIFNVLPQNKRFTFILSGLVGGSLGYIFWMKLAGPILLP